MKTLRNLTLVGMSIFALASCKKDSPPVETSVVQSQITNLHAPVKRDSKTNPPTLSGEFVKFDFSEGKMTNNDTDWDIAFRGTTILVNGGMPSEAGEPKRTGNAAAYIVNSIFSDVNAVDEKLFKQDGVGKLAIVAGSGNGWYNYNRNLHIITPIPGRVIVFRTADNQYAKVEILSYYKDSPKKIEMASESGYYTFNYVYQPKEGAITFE